MPACATRCVNASLRGPRRASQRLHPAVTLGRSERNLPRVPRHLCGATASTAGLPSAFGPRIRAMTYGPTQRTPASRWRLGDADPHRPSPSNPRVLDGVRNHGGGNAKSRMARRGAANGWHDDLVWYAAASPPDEGAHAGSRRLPRRSSGSRRCRTRHAAGSGRRDGGDREPWDDPLSLGYQSQVHGTFVASTDWPTVGVSAPCGRSARTTTGSSCPGIGPTCSSSRPSCASTSGARRPRGRLGAAVLELLRPRRGPAPPRPAAAAARRDPARRRRRCPAWSRWPTARSPTRCSTRPGSGPTSRTPATARSGPPRPRRCCARTTPTSRTPGSSRSAAACWRIRTTRRCSTTAPRSWARWTSSRTGRCTCRSHGTMALFQTAGARPGLLDPPLQRRPALGDLRPRPGARLPVRERCGSGHGRAPVVDRLSSSGSGAPTAARARGRPRRCSTSRAWATPTTRPPRRRCRPCRRVPPPGSEIAPFGLDAPAPEPVAVGRAGAAGRRTQDVVVSAGGDDQGLGVECVPARAPAGCCGSTASGPPAPRRRPTGSTSACGRARPPIPRTPSTTPACFPCSASTRPAGTTGPPRRRAAPPARRHGAGAAQAATFRPLATSVRLTPLDPGRDLAAAEVSIDRISLEFA